MKKGRPLWEIYHVGSDSWISWCSTRRQLPLKSPRLHREAAEGTSNSILGISKRDIKPTPFFAAPLFKGSPQQHVWFRVFMLGALLGTTPKIFMSPPEIESAIFHLLSKHINHYSTTSIVGKVSIHTCKGSWNVKSLQSSRQEMQRTETPATTS